MSEPKDFQTVQEALDFVAAHPSMDELMSRRPPYLKKDIRLLVRFKRAQRLAWQHAQDLREDAKEEREE